MGQPALLLSSRRDLAPHRRHTQPSGVVAHKKGAIHMHKPWLAQYPTVVPTEIDIHEFALLNDVLASGCARFADLPACNSMGTVMT